MLQRLARDELIRAAPRSSHPSAMSDLASQRERVLKMIKSSEMAEEMLSVVASSLPQLIEEVRHERATSPSAPQRLRDHRKGNQARSPPGSPTSPISSPDGVRSERRNSPPLVTQAYLTSPTQRPAMPMTRRPASARKSRDRARAEFPEDAISITSPRHPPRSANQAYSRALPTYEHEMRISRRPMLIKKESDASIDLIELDGAAPAPAPAAPPPHDSLDRSLARSRTPALKTLKLQAALSEELHGHDGNFTKMMHAHGVTSIDRYSRQQAHDMLHNVREQISEAQRTDEAALIIQWRWRNSRCTLPAASDN